MKKHLLTPFLGLVFLLACSKDVFQSTVPVQPDRTVAITGTHVVWLVFDGITLHAPQYWHLPFDSTNSFTLAGSDIPDSMKEPIVDSAQREWQKRCGADVLVTMNKADYDQAVDKEMIIITETDRWYNTDSVVAKNGSAGGVAFVGSYFFTQNTPAFVFTSELQYNDGGVLKYSVGLTVAVILHEGGHTFGLQHSQTQSDWMYTNALFGHYYGEPTTNVYDSTVFEKNIIANAVNLGQQEDDNNAEGSSLMVPVEDHFKYVKDQTTP